MAITYSNSCGMGEKLGQVLGFRTGLIHRNRFAGGLLQLEQVFWRFVSIRIGLLHQKQ
jgi:hypothetical protein